MRREARDDVRSSAAQGDDAAFAGLEPMASNSTDYIEYLSDMILELRSMAEKTNTPTLAGILDLAYREACLQVELSGGR